MVNKFIGDRVLPFLLRYDNMIANGLALFVIRAMDCRLFD